VIASCDNPAGKIRALISYQRLGLSPAIARWAQESGDKESNS
jgi:hypothetical protein